MSVCLCNLSADLMLNDEIYVTTPEFTLLQQSCQLHQANLCQMLGRYLGTWTPAPNANAKQESVRRL